MFVILLFVIIIFLFVYLKSDIVPNIVLHLPIYERAKTVTIFCLQNIDLMMYNNYLLEKMERKSLDHSTIEIKATPYKKLLIVYGAAVTTNRSENIR